MSFYDQAIDKVINCEFDLSGEEFYAECGGFSFRLLKEDRENWMIHVQDLCGGYLYDGQWLNSKEECVRGAIKEAIVGSCILAEILRKAT